MSLSGLVSITGGKWTTYRKMAQDTVDKAAMIGGLKDQKCRTEEIEIAPEVAGILAGELKRDKNWQKDQIERCLEENGF